MRGLFRRVRTLVSHWEGERSVIRNFAADTTLEGGEADFAILGRLTHWRTLDELRAECPDVSARQLRSTLHRFVEHQIVQSSEKPQQCAQDVLDEWSHWGVPAAYFHFATRNGSYGREDAAEDRLLLREQLEPVPAAVKRLRGARVALPDYPRRGALPKVLLARRSWRQFGDAPLSLHQLATLLGLTWATQKWVHVGRDIRLPLKTSPSGGACHSLEVYLAVRDIRGLPPGLYHYEHDAHSLVRLKRKWDARWIGRSLAGQQWFANASAVMFMTAVFPRVWWKYRTARAYRTVLLEAGHFCQTFCLTATWLGLAPFCTAAFTESSIEPSLNADGVTESLLYVAGVGTRPDDVAWAPYPDTDRTPRTSPGAAMHKRGVSR